MTRKPILLLALLLAAGAMPARAAAPLEHAHPGPAAEAGAPSETRGRAVRAPDWTSAPLLLPAGGMGRGNGRFSPQNLAAETIEVYGPGAVTEAQGFPVANGVAAITPADPKVGNYQWLTAREHRPGEERLASTAWYVSNPGPAPTGLMAASRPGLAIVPRLPREHAGYREGEKWDFQVRFDGQPVPDAVLSLETEFGTRTRGIADANGVTTLVFPRDFDPAKLAGNGHARPSGRFVVSAMQERDGVRHVSAFNGTYAPEPGRSRDLMAGAGFLLLGMAAAAPLLRRGEEKQ
ncbi:MAG: hypothetical protein H6R10_1821 [Rhodocyclaceae bacterium]|nr:hypothetical protein [Rhodocyclaceae bacterium]